MHNSDAENLILECDRQMSDLAMRISNLRATDEGKAFFTKYAIIQCCGTIEQSIKIIIFDKLTHSNSPQIEKYLDKLIKNGSMNPSIDNIRGLIGKFDLAWKSTINSKIDQLANKTIVLDELRSLNELRNDFAHGKSISATFSNIVDYYTSAKVITTIVDEVLRI